MHIRRASPAEIAKFQADPPAAIAVDGGNSDLQSCLILGDGVAQEAELAHQISFLTEQDFIRRATRAKTRPVEFRRTVIFKRFYRDKPARHVIIGEGAAVTSRSAKLTGEAKYREGYFDLLVLAMLLQHFPQGHMNVWLTVATPADSIDYYDRIKEVLRGTHKIENVYGETVKFKITSLSFFTESEGGLMRFMVKNDVTEETVLVYPGDRVVVVDIGGGISWMSFVGIGNSMEPMVLYDESPPPFPLGILDTIETFRNELRGLHTEVTQTYRAGDIPLRVLQRGLRTGKIYLDGSEIDVSQARLNAIAQIMDAIKGRWENDMDKGRDARLAIVTGGGGGLLLDDIKDELNLPVFAADDLRTIQFANVRGGADIYRAWLSRKGYLTIG